MEHLWLLSTHCHPSAQCQIPVLFVPLLAFMTQAATLEDNSGQPETIPCPQFANSNDVTFFVSVLPISFWRGWRYSLQMLC
jgi:hypothetical protein